MTGNHPHQPTTDGSELFTQRVEPDRPAYTLEREALQTPQIVQYKGARFIDYQDKQGQQQKTKKQLFASQAGHGPWFALWGSMNLDSQLRQLRVGAVLRIRYLGQDETVEGDRKPHLWEVTATTATPAAIDKLRTQAPWPTYEQVLLNELESAKGQEMARRDARAAQAAEGGAGPDQDDDLPF